MWRVARTAWLIVLIGVVAGSVVGEADAARKLAKAGPGLDQGPFFHGTGLAWNETDCELGCGFEVDAQNVAPFEIRAADARGRISLLDRGETSNVCCTSAASFEEVEVRASAGAVAALRFSEHSFAGDVSSSSILKAAAPGAVLRRVQACGGGSAYGQAAFDVEGSSLFYPDCGQAGGLRELDLATGVAKTVSLPADARPAALSVAGRFVAYSTRDELVVYDREAERVAYAVELKGFANFDVGIDGTVAVLKADPGYYCGGSTLSWASVTEPRLEFLPVRPCSAHVEVGAGEILFLGESLPDVALKAVNVRRGDTRTVVPARAALGPDFGVDGAGRVSYGWLNCGGGYDLMIGRVDGSRVTRPSPRCPLSLSSRRLSSDRQGQVRVPLRCARGCHGTVALRREGVVLARGPFAAEGPRPVVRVPLNSGGRRLLRRSSVARVTLAIGGLDRRRVARPRKRAVVLVGRGRRRGP